MQQCGHKLTVALCLTVSLGTQWWGGGDVFCVIRPQTLFHFGLVIVEQWQNHIVPICSTMKANLHMKNCAITVTSTVENLQSSVSELLNTFVQTCCRTGCFLLLFFTGRVYACMIMKPINVIASYASSVPLICSQPN